MKKLLVVLLLSSCGIYQSAPVDKCCETDVVYLDELQEETTVFTSLDFNTITLDFRPIRPRFHWGYSYGYWNERPLWLDYGFYNNNYYSYYSNFNRPWNYWDWYMRPWMASNSWYEGPFNNQGYNVVYNSSRRNSIQDQLEQDTNKINRKPVPSKPVIYKPLNNNNRPSYNFIPNNKPVINNSRPPINNKPVINNNRPNFNQPPRINNNSRPSRNSSKPNVRIIKNNR